MLELVHDVAGFVKKLLEVVTDIQQHETKSTGTQFYPPSKHKLRQLGRGDQLSDSMTILGCRTERAVKHVFDLERLYQHKRPQSQLDALVKMLN